MGWPFKGKKEQKPDTRSPAENRASGSAAPSGNSFPLIHGVDTAKGIALTGGTPESYRQVLSMFRKDAEERLQKFRFFLYDGLSGGQGKFPEKHLTSLTTQIQALKSASATIGAAEISAEAAMFETAGKDKDLVFIQDKLPDFVEHLSDLVKNIRASVEPRQEETEGSGPMSFIQRFGKQKPDKTTPAKIDLTEYLPIFQKLTEALKSQNVPDIEFILGELNQKSLDSKTKEILEQISDQVLMTEFDSAIRTIGEFTTEDR